MSTYYSPTDDISFVPLTRNEEKSLFKRFYASPAENPSADSLEARNEIVKRHLKLTAKLSLFYAKGSMPEDEAISAGNAGLMQALETRKFDPERGVLFSSYVRSYVRGQILLALRERAWKGTSDLEDVNMEFAPEATITGRAGGEDTCQRRGHAVVVFPSRLHRRGHRHSGCTTHRGPFESVETVDHEGENSQLKEERCRVIEESLKELPEQEARVVRDHYFGDKNFAEIGRERDLTREGVRKVYLRAMEKLKPLLAKWEAELA